jgi:tetraacyldisaccharide-1-P 4'-kinase
VLTTEKDFAKLQFLDHQLPLVVVETRFELEMPTDFGW